MSKEILQFHFHQAMIRIVDRDGQLWFVAGDVAQALGYRDALSLARWLDEDEKGTQIVSTPGGDQLATIISESGLYHALLKSRRAEARPFRRWVTEEVLPTIRKTGGYPIPGILREIPEEEIQGAERLSRLLAPYLRIFTKSKMRGEVLRAALAKTLLDVHGIDLDIVLPIPREGDPIPGGDVGMTPENLAGEFFFTLCAAALPNGKTVGQTIARVATMMPSPDRRDEKILAVVGLMVKLREEVPFLALPVRHPPLAKLLQGTRWSENGSWSGPLHRLPNVEARVTHFREFGVARAFWIPLQDLPIVMDSPGNTAQRLAGQENSEQAE
ncbi:hypothetical protein MQE22_08660 [Acidithiobacillus sp. YTS05]|nr:hypothetical protein MQE22_08660 [Acidithiobacillus sp. YTS05]